MKVTTSDFQEEDRQDVLENQRVQQLDNVKRIQADPEGRIFLRRLFADGQAFADPYTGNSLTFYNCGKQRFTREIFSDLLAVCPTIDRLREIICTDELKKILEAHPELTHPDYQDETRIE